MIPGMRLVAISFLVALAVPATAGAVLTPGRSVVNAAPVTALSVTGRSVVYAVGKTSASCGSVRLWDTATRGLWTYGERTIRGCEEGPSGGFGISAVSTSWHRAFWLTHIGGNFTDWQLWTATPTRRSPRRLAFASSESGGPAAIVLGAGTRDGVPYAVGDTVTYVSEGGARLFRKDLGSAVRLLTSGVGPGAARVLASLADGREVLLSSTGQVIRTVEHEPGDVVAIALALPGPLVQIGREVAVGAASVTLPAGARMLDHRQGRIVYRTGSQVRARRVATGDDTLLQVIQVEPWQPMLFATDSWGSGWARGRIVSWRSGPLA
jgi:hypothetical protein